MTDCINPQEVIDAIRATNMIRIGIDGKDGAGKSTLAQAVSEALGLPCISLDSFLEKKMGGYVDHIDYLNLKATMENLEGYVVEGVCLREVLRRISLVPTANIYIKRMQHGVWVDEDELDVSRPVEDILAAVRASVSLFTPGPVTGLELVEEIIRYHAECHPQDHADVTYAVPASFPAENPQENNYTAILKG
ncbi:shikimate kinase [Pseudomonas sp. SDO55104_S430]